MTAPDHMLIPLSIDPKSPGVMLGRPIAGPIGLQIYPLLVVVRKDFTEDGEAFESGRWIAIGEVHKRKSWTSPQLVWSHGIPPGAGLAVLLAISVAVDRWHDRKAHEVKQHERAAFLRATMRAKSDQIAKLQAENAAHAEDLQQVISDLPADPGTYNDRQRGA